MSVTKGSVDYTGQMERNNNINEEIVELVNRSQLSYATNNKETLSSGAATIPTNMTPPHVSNEEPTYNTHKNNNVFNVQLNYDVNQVRDPDSWDSKFQAISLHSSMEHLVSDLQNIKVSLTRMWKYILDKAIEGDNTNNINDLQGVSKVAWGFISSLYKAH